MQPTLETVKDRLAYDPDTGEFTWKTQVAIRSKAGSCAGALKRSGYVLISIDNRQYPAHRIAWLLITGEWPKGEIDHIDGDTANNRFCNLRDVSHRINMQNRHRAPTSNQTGFLGVTKKGKKYHARIRVSGYLMHLGTFDTPQAAHAVYVQARKNQNTWFGEKSPRKAAQSGIG